MGLLTFLLATYYYYLLTNTYYLLTNTYCLVPAAWRW